MQTFPQQLVHPLNPAYPWAIATTAISILHRNSWPKQYLVRRIKITAGFGFVLAENTCLCFEFFRLKLQKFFIDVAKNMTDGHL